MPVLDKAQGANPGFIIVIRDEEGYIIDRFMCKPLCPNPNPLEQQIGDKQIIVEYIFATIYAGYLGIHRAPDIRLMRIQDLIEEFPEEAEDILQRNQNINPNNEFYLVSQYLPDFQDIAYMLNNNHLEDILGFEELLSIAIYCGEVDFNHSNIATVLDLQDRRVTAKIDHGCSGTILDPVDFMNYLSLVRPYFPKLLIDRDNFINSLNAINEVNIRNIIQMRGVELIDLLGRESLFRDAFWDTPSLGVITDELNAFMARRPEQLQEFVRQLQVIPDNMIPIAQIIGEAVPNDWAE